MLQVSLATGQGIPGMPALPLSQSSPAAAFLYPSPHDGTRQLPEPLLPPLLPLQFELSAPPRLSQFSALADPGGVNMSFT